MDFSDLDFAGLGTAIAVLAKSNPIYALATGVISGIFGKALFDKKRKKKAELREKELLFEAILKQKDNYADQPEQNNFDSTNER